MSGGGIAREVADGVYRIDVNHPQPLHTCGYLIVSDGAAAMFDCGGGRRGAAAVMGGLKELGIAAEQVQWLVVTHAHLDHAGAGGLLMQALPQARFAAHPSALKHLLNPQAALAPASALLFGEEFFETYYGGLLAVEAERAQALEDGEEILIGGARKIITHYTPGHAWHHASFYDAAASFIIAGDAYGNSYRQTDRNGLGLLMPVMPPSQFDPPTMAASIRRLHDLRADAVGLAHFDVVDTATYGDTYTEVQLRALEDWQLAANGIHAKDADNFEPLMKDYLFEWLSHRATAHGVDAAGVRQMYNNDVSLSAGGFAHYMKKTAAA